MSGTAVRCPWFTREDVDGFFALFQNNLANFALIAILMAGIGFPADIIFSRMIPGAAITSCLPATSITRAWRAGWPSARAGPTSRRSPTASRRRFSSSTRSGSWLPRWRRPATPRWRGGSGSARCSWAGSSSGGSDDRPFLQTRFGQAAPQAIANISPAVVPISQEALLTAMLWGAVGVIHAPRLTWLFGPAREFVYGSLILAALFIGLRYTTPPLTRTERIERGMRAESIDV